MFIISKRKGRLTVFPFLLSVMGVYFLWRKLPLDINNFAPIIFGVILFIGFSL
ncbi:hypothetical protein RyT2_20350 [Pseudolactococcus yaeyamensis]